MDPLDKARTLILSLTSPQQADSEISKFSKLPKSKRSVSLDEYYSTMPQVAAKGDTKAISIALRVFEHFGDRSHDRMLLHYIAQAEANRALIDEKRAPEDQKNIHEALEIIAVAFADANKINQETQ